MCGWARIGMVCGLRCGLEVCGAGAGKIIECLKFSKIFSQQVYTERLEHPEYPLLDIKHQYKISKFVSGGHGLLRLILAAAH